MGINQGYVYYRLELTPKFRNELKTAAELDDRRSMRQFIIDAIRDRINRVMTVHSVPIGDVLYRPEGILRSAVKDDRYVPPER